MRRLHAGGPPDGWTALAMVGLIAAACSSSTPSNTASAPGITPTNVLIGSDQPLTGPAALGYSEIGPGSKAFFAYVNAHGGLNGRTMKFVSLDYSSRNHDGYPGAQVGVIRDGSVVLSGPAYVAGPSGSVKAQAILISVPPRELG